jgi:hypothetical protein
MGVDPPAGLDTDFTPALPTALMKPLSGSGSRAMMIDAMKTYGADSFVGRLACIFQGSADTTFYIVALYFGSVGIRKTALRDFLRPDRRPCRHDSPPFRRLPVLRLRTKGPACCASARRRCCRCLACFFAPAPSCRNRWPGLLRRTGIADDAVSVLVLRGDQTVLCAPGRPADAAGLDHEAGDDPGRPRAPGPGVPRPHRAAHDRRREKRRPEGRPGAARRRRRRPVRRVLEGMLRAAQPGHPQRIEGNLVLDRSCSIRRAAMSGCRRSTSRRKRITT